MVRELYNFRYASPRYPGHPRRREPIPLLAALGLVRERHLNETSRQGRLEVGRPKRRKVCKPERVKKLRGRQLPTGERVEEPRDLVGDLVGHLIGPGFRGSIAPLSDKANCMAGDLIGPAHGAPSRTPLATVGDGFVILRTTCRVRHVPVVTVLAHLGLAMGAAERQRHLRW